MARVPKGVLDGLRGQVSDPTQQRRQEEEEEDAYDREMPNVSKRKALHGTGTLRKIVAAASTAETPPSTEPEREPDAELDLMELDAQAEPEPEPEQELEEMMEAPVEEPAPLATPMHTKKSAKTTTKTGVKKPSYISIRHTKSPYATRRAERRAHTPFRPQDVKYIDSRYVDLMKPLYRSTRRVKNGKQQRLNIKPVVIHTKHRQLVVTPKVLDDVVEENSHDKRLLESLRLMGRIVPSATWIRYIMANARRYQQCHTAFLALDMAVLAFMINLMHDATEFHNGERHRIEEDQLRYIVQEVWPVRNNPRPPLGEKKSGTK